MNKKISGKITALITALVMLLAIMPTAVYAGNAELTSDGSGGWYILMPQTDSDTLDLTDKSAGFSFKVYDDGGPDGDYSDDCDGTLSIYVAPGYALSVTGEGCTEADYDYLRIYDDNTRIGNDMYTDTFEILTPLVMVSNCLKLKFFSDYGGGDEGFDLTVTIVAAAGTASLTFISGEDTVAETKNLGSTVTLPEFTDHFTLPSGKLFSGWSSGGNTYAPGASYTLSTDATFTALFRDPTAWDMLANAFSSASGQTTLTLSTDTVAPAVSDPLIVPEGASITLDLAGYTLNGANATTDRTYGCAIQSEGSLTLTDSVGGGGITGINMSAYMGGTVVPGTLAGQFEASVDLNYYYNGGDYTFATIYCESFEDAVHFASTPNYKQYLPYDPAEIEYCDDITITLLSDVTIAEGETVGEFNEYYNLLDLNGHTFDVRGTFTGTKDYGGGYLASTKYIIYSSVPGVFRSSGTVDVDIEQVTADTAFITDGEMSGYTAMGGNIYISGGVMHGYVGFYNSGDPCNIYIYGDAVFDGSVVYSVEATTNKVMSNMVINGDVRIADMDVNLWYNEIEMGEVLEIGNAYFGCDPNAFLSENTNHPDSIVFNSTIEEYVDQADWAADENDYSWRTVGTGSGSGNVSLSSDGAGGWYYNMPATTSGDAVLDLSDKPNGFAFKLYDDGGKNGDYSDNANSSLIIRAPAGCKVYVAGGGELSWSDYLRFYDSDGSTLLLEKENCTFPVSGLVSTGNSMKVTFRTSEYVYKRGFDLFVIVMYPGTAANLSFTYDGTTVNMPATIGFTTAIPDFKNFFALPDRYMFNGWKDASDNVYSAGDPFEVTGGFAFTADVGQEPMVLVGSDGVDYVKLPVSHEAGSSLGYNCEDKEHGYTFRIYDNGGPDGNYSNNARAGLVTIAPDGFWIAISGSGVLQDSENPIRDYVNIDDFNLWNSGVKYKGTFTVPKMYTKSKYLDVYLTADEYNNNEGFEFTVTIYDPTRLPAISFAAGEGDGSMDNIPLVPGVAEALPECSFTAPEGKVFDHYTDGVNNYRVGDSFSADTNSTLTAVYAPKSTLTYIGGSNSHVEEYPTGTTVTVKGYTDILPAPYRKNFLYWQSSGNRYDPDYSLVLNNDITLTAAYEYLPVILTDGSGNEYVDMPAFEDIELDLSEEQSGYSLKIYDDGGSSGDYSSGCNGSLIITAPTGYVIGVEGSGTCEYYDVLGFYDNETLMHEYQYGSFSYYDDMLTSTNRLKINFTSNYSYNREGFDLTVTLYGPSDYCLLSFDAGDGSGAMSGLSALPGDSVTLPDSSFTPPSGMIFDHYTDGQDEYFPNDSITLDSDTTLTAVYISQCALTFTYNGDSEVIYANNGDYVDIPFFEQFFTLPNDDWEFLYWRNVDDGEIYHVYEEFYVSGDTEFEAVLSDGTGLIPDGSGGYYAEMESNLYTDIDLSQKPLGFSFTLYDDGGENGDYSFGCDGTVVINVDPGYALSVTGWGATAEWADRLEFYDDVIAMGEKYSCEFDIIQPIVTKSNYLGVRFVSNSENENDGFELTVTIVEAEGAAELVFLNTEGDPENYWGTNIGATVILPWYDSNTPEGKVIAGWSSEGITYALEEEYTVTDDAVFTPVLRDENAWDIMESTLFSISGQSTITLTEDLIAGPGSYSLVIHPDAEVTIDLAGHTIDGTDALTDETDGYQLLVAGGELTFTDSVGSGEIIGIDMVAINGGEINIGDLSDQFDAYMELTYSENDQSIGGGGNLGVLGMGSVSITYSKGYYQSLADALHRAQDPDYKGYTNSDPENVEYDMSYISLLKDVTVAQGETLGEYSEYIILVDLNGHTFDVAGTLGGGKDFGYYVGYPYFIFESIQEDGVFRSSGDLEACVYTGEGITAYITDGEIPGMYVAAAGGVYISGGEFSGQVYFYNENAEQVLRATISGDAEIDRLQYDINTENGLAIPSVTIDGNVLINSLRIQFMGSDPVAATVLTIGEAYFGFDPDDIFPGDSYDANIVFNGVKEEYVDQADWAADETVYTWRTVVPVSVTGSVSGSNLGYTVMNVPAGATLIGARYNNGVLTDTKTVSAPTGSGTLEMSGSGSEFKLFLWNMNTLLPLCDNWEN